MDAETFQNLPTAEVARLVRAAGTKVCVFPINGTRRWFMLERATADTGWDAYLDAMVPRQVELYRLFFEHGLDTLLAPSFGPDLLERGPEYLHMTAIGWERLSVPLVDFCRELGVRVRFYGDYDRFLAGTELPGIFERIARQTATGAQCRLLIGLFANDAAETIAQLAIRYHAEHGRAPDKRTLIELYYGEYVPPVDLFIGFDKFCAFDMPLVVTGNEDLYFTVSPSPYLTAGGLRAILYDHLYTRQVEEPDYAAMSAEDWALMRALYRANREKTLGVGVLRGGIWYPLPQVTLPDGFAEMADQ